MKLLAAEQIRELDRLAIEKVGIPGPVLMETAGRAVAEAICRHFASCTLGPLLVLAGKGNNGGDGYVIARTLTDRGWQVRTLVLAPAAEIRGDAAVHLRALKRSGGEVVHASTPDRLSRALASQGWHVVVDALLGTGLSSEVQGLYRQAISWCNEQPAPVVSVDIPSGVDANGGRILGMAVQADLTVTFVAAKPGLVCYPGAACCGDLEVAEIGIPASLQGSQPVVGEFLDGAAAARLLPVRPRAGHKGSFGHLLVLAGSRGKSGAALLACDGGLHSGAGLVTLAVPASMQDLFMSRLREAMSLSLNDSEGVVSSAAYEQLMSALEHLDVLALGPGLGEAETTQVLVRRLVKDYSGPIVVDADGLNALVGHLELFDDRDGAIPVLTPHPGEMARLAGMAVADVEADRLGAALRFARSHRVVLVLKGAHTIIAAPDGRYRVNASGNPGLASGGMGDVLTGLVGGLLAQGMEPFDAAALAVFLHGHAADRLAERSGDAGMLASQVAAEIPAARKDLTNRGEKL